MKSQEQKERDIVSETIQVSLSLSHHEDSLNQEINIHWVREWDMKMMYHEEEKERERTKII